MGFIEVRDFIGKSGKYIIRPFEIIAETASDWAHEPLKRWEHRRSEESKDNDVRRQIEVGTATIKTESNIRMEEAELNANLEIKRATEIVRITKEIEEWQKDKQFERMKLVTEAVMVYQEKLTQLNINAIAAIGNMELSLREKAHNLIIDKTQKYKELQDKAIEQASEKILLIEERFAANEKASGILYNAVDASLSNIIKNASNFMDELYSDIKMLNSNIDILAKNGQRFIENHLRQFSVLSPNAIVNQLEENERKHLPDRSV